MTVVLLIEIMGTIAFAFSGGMVAIRQKLDLLGVIVLGAITAVGGGLIRDLVLGLRPPNLFRNPIYLLTALITVLVLFVIVRYNNDLLKKKEGWFEQLILVMDAVGLGAFTVIGINTCIEAGFGEYSVLVATLGVTTGVGGGILRDIMAGITPTVFQKHIYASASIAGALCCMGLWDVIPSNYAMICGAILIVMIRLLAAHNHWNLPRALKD